MVCKPCNGRPVTGSQCNDRQRRHLRPRLPPRAAELRRSRLLHLHAARVRQVDGLHGRGAGPSHRRHRLYAFAVQPLPPPLPRAARRHQARGGGGRRPGAGVPYHIAARVHARPQLHEVPQPHGHGHRGDDPRPANGLSRADGRLRQDRAGAADGRGGAGKPAISDRRPADDLALQGRSRGSLHRLPQVLDAVPRRQARPCRHRRGGGAARHHGRYLRRHGHGIHHGGHRRGAGHDAAGHGGDPGRACGPAAGSRGDGRAGSGAGAVGPDAGQDHHARDRERRACCWLGGSTNGVIHLAAIAGRLGLGLARAPQRALRHDAHAGGGQDRSATSSTWRTSSPPAVLAPCCAS